MAMSLPRAATREIPSTAEEARRLFERLRKLAVDALAAATQGNELALRRTLDERDRVAERITLVIREIERYPYAGWSIGGGPFLEDEIEEMVGAALAVQEADDFLAGRLVEIRTEVARELDRLGYEAVR
ncbi:MAG TPA: hypothetical protein VHG28_09015 [Longimicrobiaceae bacterium]|nr:hypothetical protein [Longimicrobiaceae bacterium]